MIQLLFSILFAEVGLVLVLMVKTPLRKLAIMGLDRVKRGRGPVIVKTIFATLFVLLMSSVSSIVEIQRRSAEFEALTPTDEVLKARHLLEASLLGFSMFLAWIIDRLHHYMRELRMLRKSKETGRTQNRGFEDGKGGGSESKALLEEIVSLKAKVKHLESEAVANTSKANELASLREKITQLESKAVAKEKEANTAETNDIVSLKAKVKLLESEADAKEKEATTAKANTLALRKQLDGLLLEYDRLLDDNENLRNQLKSMDRRASHSDSKKNM